MVRADLNGADGHGIFRLPQYVRRIKGGGVNVNPKVRVEREAAGMALIDGDNGMGHVVMSFAAQTAIEKAKTAGAAWVGVHHSNHAGPASLYAAMPLAHDMIGLYLAVGNANHMAPWGGIDMLLSTNPIAVAAPGHDGPIVLDMATSVAAYGKVKTAAQRGETLPEGWMIDHQGRPLTDPKRADEGLLVPIGGYKGYGLALVIGLLAGSLNGAAAGSETIDFNADDKTATNTGHAIVALSIAAFPERDLPEEWVAAIVRGGALALEQAGCTLLGGHSVRDPEIKFGYSVTGVVARRRVLTNAGVRPGDALVLTKPLGTGILATALKQQRLTAPQIRRLTRSMTQLNRAASEAAVEFGARAATDITGYGLIGHARQVADASGVTLRLRPEASWLLPRVLELAEAGVKPGGLSSNREFFAPSVDAGPVGGTLLEVLFDPQTSGGLLIALPARRASALRKALDRRRVWNVLAGEAVARGPFALELVSSS